MSAGHCCRMDGVGWRLMGARKGIDREGKGERNQEYGRRGGGE